jgi:hypothetical protein
VTLSPNIVLGNDYVTPWFAENIWPNRLKDLRKGWDASRKEGVPTVRSNLQHVTSRYFRARDDASHNDPAALDALIRLVIEALGYPTHPDPQTVTFHRGETSYDIPVIAAAGTDPDHPDVIVVAAAEFHTDPNVLIDTTTGRLASPAHQHGNPARPVPGTDTFAGLVTELFAADTHPRFVIGCSAGALVVADDRFWVDGKWVGGDLDAILGSADTTIGGELDQVCGWFSADVLLPTPEGTRVIDTAVDESRKAAVGVSESLRDGVRAGVETIVNEVLYDRRFRRHLAVLGPDDQPAVDAADLSRQAIRWMYRLVVLLYAEARPGIGIVPQDHPAYNAGYSMDRLRHLALIDLTTEAARNNTHIHQSLNTLFRLVNDGHTPPAATQLGDDQASISIEFEPLQSRLFRSESCPDIDNAHLRDHVLQKVLADLCYTPGKKGRGREAVSYANLDINQLGAVYEGLMAYTGFIAREDRYEIAARKKGEKKTEEGISRSADPARGSWTIPVGQAPNFPDDVFVTTVDPVTSQRTRVRHPKHSFVFRLAGRDRARTASFYTPSVLTEFTVRHAIDEWLTNHPDVTAGDVLNITILEPALGSGAFANETVDQLSELYLRLRETETGQTVPPETRPDELRRLRAHFAINRTYGVDLNATAVELAEVSLWLNAMHPGLAAPPLDARLRRGNSLIGATRATYPQTKVTDTTAWKKSKGTGPVAPEFRHPAEHPYGTQGLGIHQFLLPGEGWGAAAKTGKTVVRELNPDWCDTVWDWQKRIKAKPTSDQVNRLARLSNRIESLWADAAADVTAHHTAHNVPVPVWNNPNPPVPTGPKTGRYNDPNGPYRRLKTIMDAWCALWMWAPANGTALPTLTEWIDAVDYLAGNRHSDTDGRLFAETTTHQPSTTTDDGALFSTTTEYDTATSITEARTRWPWLTETARIADAQGFFHWELDYAPVYLDGGWDLQAGNPPWVRLDWDEPSSLAEIDPWWGVTDLTKTADKVKKRRRVDTLERPGAPNRIQAEGAENLGLVALLGSSTREPLLEGLRTNLYMNFITGALRRTKTDGAVGLIHPESHFADPSGGPLRESVYLGLRRHWQFANEQRLFEDVDNNTEFGVHVYAHPQTKVAFRQAVNLLQPATLDASINHPGDSDLPGIKHPDGDWDLRPHRDRIVTVTDPVLEQWVLLFDPPGTPHRQSRLLRPLTAEDLDTLAVFANQSARLADTTRYWTSGFNEKNQKDDGTFEWRTETPSTLTDVILQGPHILNANPFAQQPRPNCKSNKDWDALDLENLPPDFIPRTNYQRLVSDTEFERRQTKWGTETYSTRYREAHREFVNAGHERTVKACILPSGPPHLYTLNTIAREDNRSTALWAGFLCSLPYDYLVKSSGAAHLVKSFTDQLPVPAPNPVLETALLLRTLRLNCVTTHYAPLWSELFEPAFRTDRFEGAETASDLRVLSDDWSPDVPLRSGLERWLALCEIDAIVALLLGTSEDQLAQMFKSQFGVLSVYEHSTVFDCRGRQVSREHHAWTARQQAFEDELKAQPKKRGDLSLKLWDRVCAVRDGDSDVDLGYLVGPFRRADRELAMRTAYRAFADRSGKTDGVSDVPLWEWEVWGG